MSAAMPTPVPQYIYWETHLVACYHKARPNAVSEELAHITEKRMMDKGSAELWVLQLSSHLCSDLQRSNG